MTKFAKLIILIGSILALTGCSTTSPHQAMLEDLVDNLNNDDIQWRRVPYGKQMMVSEDGVKLWELKDPGSIPLLVEALEDEDKYIAAHIVLSLLTTGPVPFTEDMWKGMKLKITESGMIEEGKITKLGIYDYGPNAQEVIIQYWKEKNPLSIYKAPEARGANKIQ